MKWTSVRLEMDVQFILVLFAFIIVSYNCYFKFSGSKEALLVTKLQEQFEDVECPAGISLYRLQREGVQFRVQVQTRLPHNPSAINQIVKRCEKETDIGEGTESTLSNTEKSKAYAKRRQSYKMADDMPSLKYTDVDMMTSRLLQESCETNDDDIQECEMTNVGKAELIKNSLLSNSLMSYLLEVVNIPADNNEEENHKKASETWSTETLTKGIFPGTLWCGFGNIADDTFGKLGEHSETDDCCRSHDLCKPIIKAFQTRYSYPNPGIVPISHCACDMEFYNCLLRVNSATSKMIGKIFFNLVKMKCFDFDLRDVCISSLFGLCFERGEKCVAVIKRNPRFQD